MKKFASMMMTVILMFAMLPMISMAASADAVLPHTGASEEKKADDLYYSGFCGRFSVSAVDLDVALYNDYAQSVCDREDSACFFSLPSVRGMIIADHCHQEFSTLTDVYVGAVGEITDPNGNVTYIRCTEVFDGRNTGYAITDDVGNVVMGQYDYMTYTCLRDWQHVRVCQWEVIEQKNMVPTYRSLLLSIN